MRSRTATATTIPAITHRLPRPSALGSCAEPSWVQYAPNTCRPPAAEQGVVDLLRYRSKSTYPDTGIIPKERAVGVEIACERG